VAGSQKNQTDPGVTSCGVTVNMLSAEANRWPLLPVPSASAKSRGSIAWMTRVPDAFAIGNLS